MELIREGLRVLLVRHAEQVQDGQNGGLTERGRQQAACLGAALGIGPDDRVVTSPLARAMQTAEVLTGVADAMDQPDRVAHRSPTVVDDLREFEFGPRWTWELAGERDDLVLWRPEHNAGAESLREFQGRVVAAFESVVNGSLPGSGARIVCVIHSGVLDALLRWAFGCDAEAPWVSEAYAGHTSVTELEHWTSQRHDRGAPRHTVVRRIGDVSHLPAELVSGQ